MFRPNEVSRSRLCLSFALLGCSILSPLSDVLAAEREMQKAHGKSSHSRSGQAASQPAAQKPKKKPSSSAGINASGDAEAVEVHAVARFAGGRFKKQVAPESRSSVGAAYIAQQAAAASPLQIIQNLPGVNYGTSDTFGLSNRQNFNIRGLNQTEIGWVVEGMPGIDMVYYQPYIETWADNENVSDLTVLQGTSRLYDPVATATGGELIETIRDPSDKMGGHIGYAAGSYRAQRVFVRADSGYIGNTGLKMFGSYSYVGSDNFSGSGRSHRTHIDYKAVKEWKDKARSSLFFSFDDWYIARSKPVTLSGWESANDRADGFSALNYSGTYTAGQTTDYWKPNIYKYQDVMASFQNWWQVTDRLRLHLTPYMRWEKSDAAGQTALSTSSIYNGNQKVLVNTDGVYFTDAGKTRFSAMTNTLQNIYTTGMNLYGDYDVSDTNRLTVGYWYEHWNISTLGGLAPMNQYGETENDFGKYVLKTTDGDMVAGSHYQESYNLHSLYVTDSQDLLNHKLKVAAGFKEMLFNLSGTNQAPGSQYHYAASFSRPMPRLSVSYAPNREMQVYLNATTNTRVPMPANTYPNLYSVSTGKLSQVGNEAQQPEYAISEELGFRYHGVLNFSLALFNMNITNHQVSTLVSINGAQVSQAISMGGETARGVTAEIAGHRYWGLAPYVNGQFLHATMDNNFKVGNDALPTAGKIAVQSPKFMANIGLNYQHGPYYANLSFKWVDSQYSTFMNNQSMPAYKTVDLGFGYHFPSYGPLHNATLGLNFTNLTNVRYLSSVATVVSTAKSMRGVYGTTIAAGTPAYYMAAPLGVMMNLSTDF